MSVSDVFRLIVTALLTIEIVLIPAAIMRQCSNASWLFVVALDVLLVGRWAITVNRWGEPIVWWGTPVTCIAVVLLGAFIVVAWSKGASDGRCR